jgi:hypothetical protein
MDDDAAGIGMGERGGIECGFERGRGTFVGVAIGSRESWRRHLARAQFAGDAFPRVGFWTHLGHVEAIEHEAGGLESLVVAGNAVAIENRTDGLDCRSFGLGEARRVWPGVPMAESGNQRSAANQPRGPGFQHHGSTPCQTPKV